MIKKGDNVRVTCGDDKGRTGKVLRSFPKLGKVVVESVNLKKKHQRPTRKGQRGQLIEKPAPINISNVTLVESGGSS